MAASKTPSTPNPGSARCTSTASGPRSRRARANIAADGSTPVTRYPYAVRAAAISPVPQPMSSDGSAIPVFSFRLVSSAPYTVFDVSERLRTAGWQVPAYTMPEAATDEAIMRVVIREGFSYDLADDLIGALRSATDYLSANPPRLSTAAPGFDHT